MLAKNNNEKSIQIKAKTWIRDSHGLFDYENNEQIKTVTLNINCDSKLIRNQKKNDVEWINTKDNKEKDPEEYRELAKIIKSEHKFELSTNLDTNMPVNNDTLQDLQEKIWYVIKSNNSNCQINSCYQSNFQYILKKNDIIKLGRIKFLIRDMNIVEGNYLVSSETFKQYQEFEKTDLNENCRLCYDVAGDDETNPMLSICKCKGSVNNIHLNCLKLWLQQKLTKKEITSKSGMSYTIKSFNCELCKEPYPITIKNNGKFFDLLNYYIPNEQNYIILESLNSIKENQYPLSVHILMFIDESPFILGRGHDSDVRISDISVSRTHAKIYLKDKNYYLEDTGSKFGTLVLAKEKVPIEENKMILQIGRTLLSINTYKHDNIISNKKENFLVENKLDMDEYYNEFKIEDNDDFINDIIKNKPKKDSEDNK